MNKQLLFVKRPQGEADASTWSLVTNPIPEINEGEILVKQHYVSLDPAMRGWMNEGKSYIEPMAIGSVMRAGSVGEVVAVKNHPNFKVGDYVSGSAPYIYRRPGYAWDDRLFWHSGSR
jgi:NADPH-dependent curcumin reductase CurA